MEKESERQPEQEEKVKKVCKRCHQNYTPSSNTPSSCRYHPSFFVCRRHDDQKRCTTLPRTLYLSAHPSIWVFHDVFAYPFLKFHCFFGYVDSFSCSFQYPCAYLDYLLDISVCMTEKLRPLLYLDFGCLFCLYV